MPVMLERWNDDRMDALAAKVDGIDVQLLELRRETREDMRELRREMKEGFERMARTMIGLAGTVILALATVMATQL